MQMTLPHLTKKFTHQNVLGALLFQQRPLRLFMINHCALMLSQKLVNEALYIFYLLFDNKN